eukprot:5963899-Lingulodinium_polyedra.AAC.1
MKPWQALRGSGERRAHGHAQLWSIGVHWAKAASGSASQLPELMTCDRFVVSAGPHCLALASRGRAPGRADQWACSVRGSCRCRLPTPVWSTKLSGQLLSS